MNKERNLAAVLLFSLLLSVMFVVPLHASTYGLSLETTDADNNPKTSFVKGEKLYLNIIATELQSLAGCAFTLNYNKNVLTAPVTDPEGVAASGIMSMFPFTFVKEGHPDTGAVTMRENSSTAGTILFSGAAIDTTTGGGKHTTSTPGNAYPLFRVEFTVKTDADTGSGYAFSLSQTILNNTDAGYPAEGAGVPVLVGAVPQSDTTNWNDLTDGAFPVLLAAMPSSAPATTFSVVDQPLYTVTGTITYTGKQTGTLKVAGFSDAALTTTVGTPYSIIAWVGTSMTYTISVPTGSVYVGAFIDSGTANTTPAATEAQGAYASAITVGTAAVTGKDISIADPMLNGLPTYWSSQYATFNNNTGIGSSGDDADHDGYTNLVEYQNGTDPTVANAPNGTGYDPALDTRDYTISGTISYNGTQTGTLKVGLYDSDDPGFISPVHSMQVDWSGTSQSYSFSAVNGYYVVAAYIDSNANNGRDASEAQGSTPQITLAGNGVTSNFAISDPSTATHKIFFAGSASLGKNAQGKYTLRSEIPEDKTLRAFNVKITYDPAMLTLVAPTAPATNPVASGTCPVSLKPANINSLTLGEVIFNGFHTTGQTGPLTFDWMDFQFAGKGNEGSTALTITVNSYGYDGTDQFKPKSETFALKLSYVRGDADGSESVDIFDALIVAEFDALLKVANDLPGYAVADVDSNERVDIFDALKIAEFDAGLIPNLD